jgi:glycerol-3-phosphate dehydrogenase
VLEKLKDGFPNATGAWTEEAPLPGGEMSGRAFSEWFADLCRLQAGFATEDLLRFARRYGTRVDALLDGAKSAADLGPNLGGDLTAAEVRFLKATEWAQTVDDVLWRRTKAGLHVGTDQRATLARRVDEVLSGS